MKTKLILLLLFTAFAVKAQQFKTPLEYLNYIGKETDNISKSTWKYTTTVAHSKSPRKIDNTRKTLIKSIETASKKIEALKDGYKGDVEYRDQILAYLSFTEKEINEEYDKIIDMQEISEQSYDAMEAYIMLNQKVNDKIEEETEKINTYQTAFGNKYHIQMGGTESEIGKKMKISNEVFDNRTKLYLIFFKVNFTETSMMAAIQKKDINAIQQSAGALGLYADEGLEKLKTFQPYKNDQSLVLATKKVMEVAKKESTEFAPGATNFLMLNQKFEESKTAMENKDEAARTKAEIDNYNKLVKDVNKEIGNYNKLSDKYVNDSNSALQNWNNTADNFVARYVPED